MVAYKIAKERKGTCSVCRKRRNLFRRSDIKYRSFCSECLHLNEHEMQLKRAEAREEAKKKPKARIAYPIIGGPLDGLHATTADFQRGYEWGNCKQEEGMYHHLANEYIDFNCGHGTRKQIGSFPPSMVFIHKSVLKPLISPKER